MRPLKGGLCLLLLLAGGAAWALDWQGERVVQVDALGLEDLRTRRPGLGLALDLQAYLDESIGARGTVGYFQVEGAAAEEQRDTNALFLEFGPILRLPGRVSPFVSGGAGLFLTNYSAAFEVSVGEGGSADVREFRGELSLGLWGGAGFQVALTRQIGLGLEARASSVLLQGKNLQLGEVRAGLRFTLD